MRLDRCEICGVLIPPRRRRALCWRHLLALRELGLLAAAAAAVTVLSAIN